MYEDFLHYLWKYQLISDRDSLEFESEPVEILNVGEHNNDSGPDFFNSKVRIGNTVWVGNVEVHLKSSDWIKHNHHADENYDNVILHVVGKNDEQIFRKNGEPIPTVEIRSPENIYNQYNYLMQNKGWIPCETFVSDVDQFTMLQWKEALLVERLQQKSEIVKKRYSDSGNNFEQAFYESLAANFGFKTNALPFELLAKSLPLNVLAKHKDQLPLIEALLFGQAGLLPDEPDSDYEKSLIVDYRHLKAKYNLKTGSGSMWKFMRMRPQNFPTIRIAQFASLIHSSRSLFSKILETEKAEDIKKLFNIKASGYWDTHYTFGNDSAVKEKHLGESAFHNIVINTIAPVFFFYSGVKGKPEFAEKALAILEQIPDEKNRITKSWADLGVFCDNSFDSQALIQLKNVYCKDRKCLLCRIGNKVIKQ